MGNYRFKLSDVIPKAWIYKLKDVGSSKARKETNNNNQKHTSNPDNNTPSISRKSNYFTRELKPDRTLFLDPCRKSSKQKLKGHKRRTTAAAAASMARYEMSSFDYSSPSTSTTDSSPSNIVLEVLEDGIPEVKLHPIITKPTKMQRQRKTDPEGSFPGKEEKLKITRNRKSSSLHSPGVKLRRVNSPRIASRRRSLHERKSVSSSSSSSSSSSLSDSFVVVKLSSDPYRDFRDSMAEMIVENDIKASKDLEQLLACYLSLNADEYHDLIIKVFKHIWVDLIHSG